MIRLNADERAREQAVAGGANDVDVIVHIGQEGVSEDV